MSLNDPPEKPRGPLMTALERFGHRVSWVMSGIILTLIYFVLLGPFSLLAGRWLVGWQPSRELDLEKEF
jgi:hypothetical protein